MSAKLPMMLTLAPYNGDGSTWTHSIRIAAVIGWLPGHSSVKAQVC
ncbi:MAG TPA: hypothetical protein VHI14_01230 [Jatrophihabitantaceae bacterium]|nr:hypothetical protein [Jatrophihabitantaceae bacterium]